MKKITFNECPRPQFVRDEYQILDGSWDFIFDEENNGEKLGYKNGFIKQYNIEVPFSYQTKLSGIGVKKRCDNIWYQKELSINKKQNKKYILHLEGADYHTLVYLNGNYVGDSFGAYSRHSFDLTKYLSDEKNLLVIKCEDDYSIEKPRGKQKYKPENFECWYTETNGLYKSVWIEEVNNISINDVKITPSFKEKCVNFKFNIEDGHDRELFINIIQDDKISQKIALKHFDGNVIDYTVTLKPPYTLWEVGKGGLYELEFLLYNDGSLVDKVSSYFGLRDIEARNGKIYLNDKELYEKLVLDQGYFIDSGLTAPSLKVLYEDIEKMKTLGFNGCRKHQKVEDDRFAYYCDVTGYLLWCEMPSSYDFTNTMKDNFRREWMEIVKQEYNHPSIITWTPFNESWGIKDVLTDKEQQDFTIEIYNLTKEYDKTRFVICNDGWEHTISDIITIHHYEQDPKKLLSYFETIDKAINGTLIWDSHHKGAFAKGFNYNGQPIIFSEFGGTAYIKNATNGAWGYGVGVKDDNEYIERVTGLVRSLNSLCYSSGYCYTQVSDVEQEVNGLLFFNRNYKVDPEKIKKALDERN